MSLHATFVASSSWSTKTLMHLPALATTTTPLNSGSWNNELEPICRRLRPHQSLPILPRLGLNLNHPPPYGILKLGKGTITSGRHQLSNLNLEHAQVRCHLSLLQGRILRTKKSPLNKHLSDLIQRLCRLPQWHILLSQPLSLSLHLGNILREKHLLEPLPSNNSPLFRSIGTGH